MRTHTEGFFDHGSTGTTVLTGVVGCHGNHRDVVQERRVVEPLEEDPPTSIMDRFSQFAISDHIADGKVFIGNQVARRDQRACLLSGKIFTLPLHLQMLLGKSFPCFLAIGRLLLFARESSLESLESFLSSPMMSRVGYAVSLRISQEAQESHIDPDLPPRWDVLNSALRLDGKLHIVAVSPTEDANPLDVFDGEGFNILLLIANQPESADPTAIREGDMLTIIGKLPSSLLIFHAPVVVLKSWVALLSRLVAFAVLIEPRDRTPGPGSRGLSGLGVEQLHKGVCFRKGRAIVLQVVFGDTTIIHPQAQTGVANELNRTDCLVDGVELLLVAMQFVLIDQHVSCFRFGDVRVLYSILSVHIKQDWYTCPKNESTSMSPHGSKNNLKDEARRKVCLWQKSSDEFLMPIWLGMIQRIPLCPSSRQAMPLHPRLIKNGAFWAGHCNYG